MALLCGKPLATSRSSGIFLTMTVSLKYKILELSLNCKKKKKHVQDGDDVIYKPVMLA